MEKKEIVFKKVEQVFNNHGYERFEMEKEFGKYVCYKTPKGDFVMLDHFSKSYVIEWAENEKEARDYIFEDTDLFDDGKSVEEIVSEIDAWLVKYIDNDE